MRSRPALRFVPFFRRKTMNAIEIKTVNHEWFGKLYDLYERAFPVAERRDRSAFVEKLMHEPRFHCMAIVPETDFAGMLTYWQFDSFLYIEHFAISEELRGNNLGGRALSGFVQDARWPVVLEAETPETAIARRRIAFYERHHFHIVRTDYLQPPYRKGGESIPMYLMCTARAFADEQIRELQLAVYGKFYVRD